MIKNWIEFIKESLQEKVDEGKFWKLDEDDIRDFLLDLSDDGYNIIVNFGFLEESENYKGDKFISYTEVIKPDESMRPAYWIDIYKSRISNDDLTDSLLFAWDIIKERIDGDLYLHDEDGTIDINDIEIKGGFFIGRNKEESEKSEAYGHISIFAVQKNEFDFTQKEIADYYGWKYDKVSDKGTIFTHIDLEEMADQMLSRNSNYKEALVKGTEYMWDYYESHYYTPDTQSLFQYTLDKENETLLVKSIIKEAGGLEEIKRHIGDECDDEIYDNIKDIDEEDLIKYLLKERFYSTIKQLVVSSDIYSEITQTVADWEMSAHVDANLDEIESEFDDIVEKEFEFTKIRKEVTKKYKSKDSEGNTIDKEYQTEVTFYEIPFDGKWIEGYDSSDLSRTEDIYDLFREYCGKSYFTYEMNPRISDSGNVDSKGLNSEIRGILNNFLKRD
jgi:hypothetical protein